MTVASCHCGAVESFAVFGLYAQISVSKAVRAVFRPIASQCKEYLLAVLQEARIVCAESGYGRNRLLSDVHADEQKIVVTLTRGQPQLR